MKTKYRCDLCLSADGTTTGIMMLTKEEYEIVRRVSDVNNWQELDAESWSGYFGIFCEELEHDHSKINPNDIGTIGG